MKYQTVNVTGYWTNEPERQFDMTVALGEWDGVEDAEDERIFFYMDRAPLSVGQTIAENFVVTAIY